MTHFGKVCLELSKVLRAVNTGIERANGEAPDQVIQKKPEDHAINTRQVHRQGR